MSHGGDQSLLVHQWCPLPPSLLFCLPPSPLLDFAFTAVILQDHALPVGTEVTDTSLAGVLGLERDVCVPVTSSSISTYTDGDDGDCGKNISNNNNNGSSGNNNSNNTNGSNSDENSSRAWLGQALVLKLRQVNGDGVMSGVWYFRMRLCCMMPVCLTYSEYFSATAADVLLHY